MPMTFKEAKNKLKEIAGGKYHSIYYQLTETASGELFQSCTLYIGTDPQISSYKTWEEAFLARESVPQETIEAQMP